MDTELRARLDQSLGDAYRLERELGGGGMSRVYVAEETALGRRVVVKVLPPELASGVNAERFRREVQLAAGLQHPHVVPVLSAGAADGMLYYTMPYVAGESLRARLAREGALPVADAVRVLREVADALAHAHAHGVVHRDVKPGNILLAERHAVVTDFGIARALSAAAADADTLTATGLALGTPAYMAPEQAIGDAHVDHRADLYALGAVAYELLAGQPPFAGPDAQAVLAAHVTRPPVPLRVLRPAVPVALEVLVMRCLEKNAADRPQSAEEVLDALEKIPSAEGDAGVRRPASSTPPTLSEQLRRAHPATTIGLYLLAAATVLGVTRLAMLQLGLPDWVIMGAAGLLVVGLPIIAATAVVQHAGHDGTPAGAGSARRARAHHWLTWRRAISGGVLAFAAFALAVGVYAVMRALGIGPVGSLVAAGVVTERERILIADFENRTRDSTLGLVITEAFRIDFAQSPLVRLVASGSVRDALGRMRLAPGTHLDPSLAREVALREGVRAVVTGDVAAIGDGFVLSAQLVSADSGDVLAAFRETASDSTGLLRAVDRLSRRLRERLGESLRTIRESRPLYQVTTNSLEALRKYMAGREATWDGDAAKAVALLEEAIALDTTFAMAHRGLGIALGNFGYPRSRMVRALTNAYRYRDRLTDRERYATVAAYYESVTGERDKALATYRSMLDRYPEALNNIGLHYEVTRDYARAEPYYQRQLELGASASSCGLCWSNLVLVQINQGKFDVARRTLERVPARLRSTQYVTGSRIALALASERYEEAEAQLRARRRELGRPDPTLAGLLLLHGRVAAAEEELREWAAWAAQAGRTDDALIAASHLAFIEAALRGRTHGAAAMLDSALARLPLEAMSGEDRPYLHLADAFATAGRPHRSRELLAAFDATADLEHRPLLQLLRHQVVGTIELAEGKYQRAIAEFKQGDREGCPVCAFPGLGRAYDLSSKPDSAIATYERFLTVPWEGRVGMGATQEHYVQLTGPDERHRAAILRRLGELHEARGDTTKAREFYARFVELWKDCDAELRPQIDSVRARLARLDRVDSTPD